MNRLLIALFFVAYLYGCDSKPSLEKEDHNPLFVLLSPEKTNILFANTLEEGLNTNVLMYEYFYNGGGVAVGDLNGDSLQDIYFSGNMTDNKLYLNKGNLRFEDVTSQAAIAGRPGPWKTGIAMADINGDGRLDIYVCYSGKLNEEQRKNQLFINNGNDDNGIPVFTEQAEKYGLDHSGYATQAAFFDYDRDGDLDMVLLNHNPKRLSLNDISLQNAFNETNKLTGLLLFRNNNGVFADITGQAGMKSSSFSYGLGLAVSDVNNDGWPDVYVSNDYIVPDALYINHPNGIFTNELTSSVGHISQFSMGNNISDINNDGLPDIYTLDMLPEDNRRQKLLFAPDNYEEFNVNVNAGFHYQYMRNMLHLNNGNGTFSEIGQLAGISNTDWSWAPLFADYDNDGWKDLYVTNGYLRDYTNMDFLKYIGNKLRDKKIMRQYLLDLIREMPSSDVVNYMYKNAGGFSFDNVSKQWGLDNVSNSNGAAYADLDNDGDLDLIVNNINRPAFIYKNEANKRMNSHYLKIKLDGQFMNTEGIGSRICIYLKGTKQYLEQFTSRGFQSSVSSILHFGLGEEKNIDSLHIIWSGGKEQVIVNIKSDQQITLMEKDAVPGYTTKQPVNPFFEEVSSPVSYKDTIININDFKRQPLLINPFSLSGPCLVKGDVNNDGLEDVYVGGGSGQTASLYIQQRNGRFLQKKQFAFEADKMSEDADAVFTDMNGDGFPDLYVACGGYHNYSARDTLLQDRLYLNDGNGNFKKSINALPKMLVSKSCVRSADFNRDGFTDLFIGGRVIPGRYPEPPESFLLINDGKGTFTNEIASIAPSLQQAGMITDAAWADINGDGQKDLVTVGEWMPVNIFINNNGRLENRSKTYFNKEYNGWWNRLLIDDLNGDGKPDLVIGNMGLNIQFHISDHEPAEMHYKDFDGNGVVDPIFSFYIQGKTYPYISRDELLEQIGMMRSRFPDYKSYADATLAEVFRQNEWKEAKSLRANCLKTIYFESSSDTMFHEKNLPVQVQFSPVFTITSLDYDNDGKNDLLIGGNINHARLRFGKYDANYGTLLHNEGNGAFSYVHQDQSGFNIWGDVRSVIEVNNTLLFGINQQTMKAYKLK